MEPLSVLKSILLSLMVIAGLSTANSSQAVTITFDTSDSQFDPGVDNQGWWSALRANTDDNDNYAVQIDGDQVLRNFFTFDLSSLAGIVTSATLELQRYFYLGDPEGEIWGLFDVSTDAETLNDNRGLSAAISDDLASGTSYGEFIVTDGDPLDLLSFTLNTSAIADINAAAGGFFSIGGALLQGDADLLFGVSGGAGTQRLVLNIDETVAIPEPGTFALLGVALAGLALARKRHLTSGKVECR